MSDNDELELLKKTFEEFMRTSADLEKSYADLKAESHRLSLFLANILESIDSALLVFNLDLHLQLWNRKAIAYFPALTGASTPTPDLAALQLGSPLPLEQILHAPHEVSELEIDQAGAKKYLEIHCSDFLGGQNQKAGSLLLIRDKSEFHLLQLRSQREDRLRVMGELAAEVAHEIRNPLGSLELMLSLLSSEDNCPPQSQETLTRMRHAVNTMNRTVTNILLYTKNIELEISQFSDAELLKESQSLMLDLVVKKGLDMQADPCNCALQGDFELLKQCIGNILINAAQAVSSNGKIAIRSEVRAHTLAIRIRDNGPGISAAHQDKIFNPFFTTKNTGTGLGLAMVKRVIEAHHGAIQFTSDEQGTTFTIELPIA